MSTPLMLAAAVGIDWADDHHDIMLQAAGAATVEQSRLAHTPAAIAGWIAQLRERFDGQYVGVALETSRGPLVQALLEAPFLVLYPVNPRSLHRFRETFFPNGAKDDAPDAALLLELLTKHRDRLQAWMPDDAATRLLQRLVEQRRRVVDMRTGLVQQLQATLKEYYPLALGCAGDDLASQMATDFLAKWPTLATLQRARSETVRRFYRQHGVRRAPWIAARLTEIRDASPLTRDGAVIESDMRYVQLLVGQLRALRAPLEQLDRRIAECFAAHADGALFASFPGAGAALAPRLLAAFGTDRARFATASAMQMHVGIAPITVRSGRQCHVRWRWATSAFLRQTFHEFALYSVRHCDWARHCYRQQRERGKPHHVAVRALAFKWIRILWRCWQDRTPYDGARYERALHQRHSPLHARLSAQSSAEAA